MSKPVKVLGPLTLAMMSVAAVISLRSLPFMASFGLSAVFLYLAAAVGFLLPSSLVCAELASTWPRAGGIYRWVSLAFNEKTGFFTMWLEWINNVISFPATLTFLAVTISYLLNPALAQHKTYMLLSVLIIFWGGTFLNFLGIKTSSRLNVLGALSGLLIPGIIIIVLGLCWWLMGYPMQLQVSMSNLLSHSQTANLAFFSGLLSAYSGMQVTAFHATNVRHPKKDYPRAIALAVVLIVATTILATLAIASVVPNNQLQLISGLIDGYSRFFQAFHIPWAVSILVCLIVLGAFSELCAWLLGPARGLAVAAQDGHFPKIFARETAQGSPRAVLILQAIIASVLVLLLVIMPNINTGFWLLIDLSSQSTILMYLFIFAAYIRLRYKEKNTPRSFSVGSKNNIFAWMVGVVGIITCGFALIVSFDPPAQLQVKNVFWYEAILIGGNIIYLSVPLIIYLATKRRKAKDSLEKLA
jgi:amino acid transporter